MGSSFIRTGSYDHYDDRPILPQGLIKEIIHGKGLGRADREEINKVRDQIQKENAEKDLAALKKRRQREKSQVEELVIQRDKLQDEVKSLEKQVKRLRQQVDTLEYSTPDFEPREA
jgi:predicted RNase H-like nuclease (RuvC/YqgF family)